MTTMGRTIRAKIVHHTGTMIRFRPSQLAVLPSNDVDAPLLLPTGITTRVHFRRNVKNPNVTGPGLVAFIKTRLEFGETRDVVVTIDPFGNWVLRVA